MTKKKKPPNSHFSPVFSNVAWTEENHYLSYYRCEHNNNEIKKSQKGKTQWGKKKGLYSWDLEISLNKKLETEAAEIYKKLCCFQELSAFERRKWSQFLMTQLVRTVSFIKYEKTALSLSGIQEEAPKNDRIGCLSCDDLKYLVNRNWCYLLAEEGSAFVRSDNPVLMTGFVESPATCLYYPLTPRLCLVLCSMDKEWDPNSNTPKEMVGYEINSIRANLINFYLARSCDYSLIIPPSYEGIVSDEINEYILGRYPQPPFRLHVPNNVNNLTPELESIKTIMNISDFIEYPDWDVKEIEPFYYVN